MTEPATTTAGGARPPSRALLRSVLGEVLRRERLEQRRTLADVAAAASVSMPYLSEVERGLKEVSSEVLAALCEALGLDLSEILAAVVFSLTGDTIVISLAAGRRETTPEGPMVTRQRFEVAPPVRRPGDAYALAA
jgi:transcriptional regulator with XRE-family HTH domain